MKVLVLPIGKMKSRPLQELAADYAKRLTHYLPIEVVVCRDERQALAQTDKGDLLVLLDQRGEQLSSEQLAEFIGQHQMRGTRRMVFHVGGPDGVGEDVRGRAGKILGLSRMTLPHEMAQVVLLEQLYRAATILKGESYHK